MLDMEMNNDFKSLLAIEVEHVSQNAPVCPFIMGEPGIGKSSIMRAMCKERKWWFFEVLCNQLGDRADLTGCRSVKTIEAVNGKEEEVWKQIFFPHQEIQDAITCAKNHPDDIVVLFLDEINRTSSDITSAILSFTTARKIGTYTFPDNIRFIVAGNDKGNITSLDSASISRFVKFKLHPSATTYMSIEENLNPYIKQVLTANPEYIFCKSLNIVTSEISDDEGDDSAEATYEAFNEECEGFEQITTPRTISGLNAFLNKCTTDMLCHYISQISRNSETGEETSMLQTIVEGHVGNTLFSAAICAAIAEDVSRGMLQKANTIVAPTKPPIYDQILKCQDRQIRNSMIAALDDNQKSSVILYATYEKGINNGDLIVDVAKNYGGQLLTSEYMPQFTNLKSHDELDVDNYTALINSQTNLGNMIKNILGD